MRLKFCMLGLCASLLPWSASLADTYNDREILLTEFVKDMGSLEDSRSDAPASYDLADALLDDALSRLGSLGSANSQSLGSVIEAFSSHRKLAIQLAASADGVDQAANADPAVFDDMAPRLRIRLENLTQNYLHLAQLVLSDTLGNPDHRLAISAETKQRVLEIVARYPVDKPDADGYLSALWFIREGMKKWKCEGEV